MGPEALARPEIAALLSQPIIACLATINPDGSPHQTYVWFTWTGNEILISTAKGRVKHRNLLRDPRASLAILDPENGYCYIAVSGTVTISEENAGDLIVDEAVHYMGEERGRPYGEQMRTNDRVVLRLKPEKVSLYGF